MAAYSAPTFWVAFDAVYGLAPVSFGLAENSSYCLVTYLNDSVAAAFLFNIL